MKKSLYLIFGLFALNSFAQAPNFAWVKKSTSISNSYVSQTLNSHAIVVDTNNHFVYCLSGFTGEIDFGAGTLPSDYSNPYLVKYDLGGTIIWSKAITTNGENYPTGMALDPNGNIVICGYSDAADTLTIGSQSLFNQNAGASESYLSYIAKLDINGNCIWLRGSGNQGSGLRVQAVTTDNSGNVYATGTALDPNGTFCGNTVAMGFFAIKLNAAGTSQWFNQSTTYNVSQGNSVTIDHNGDCIIVGSHANVFDLGPFNVPFNTGSSFWDRFATKISPSGTYLWVVARGVWQGPEVAYHVSTDSQNNIYISGMDINAPDSMVDSSNDVEFLEKCDPNGNQLWFKWYECAAQNPIAPTMVTSHITSPSGDTYVLLAVNDSTDFDGTIIASSPAYFSSSYLGVVVKYNTNGTQQWVKHTTDNGLLSYAEGLAIALDQGENVYFTGMLQNSMNFDNFVMTTDETNYQWFFLAKLGDNPLALDEQSKQDLLLYPNPANSTFQINAKGTIDEVVILNAAGMEVYRGVSKLIDVSGFSKGFYVVSVSVNGSTSQSKLLVD